MDDDCRKKWNSSYLKKDSKVLNCCTRSVVTQNHLEKLPVETGKGHAHSKNTWLVIGRTIRPSPSTSTYKINSRSQLVNQTLTQASWEKSKNRFSIGKSLQCCSLFRWLNILFSSDKTDANSSIYANILRNHHCFQTDSCFSYWSKPLKEMICEITEWGDHVIPALQGNSSTERWWRYNPTLGL